MKNPKQNHRRTIIECEDVGGTNSTRAIKLSWTTQLIFPRSWDTEVVMIGCIGVIASRVDEGNSRQTLSRWTIDIEIVLDVWASPTFCVVGHREVIDRLQVDL